MPSDSDLDRSELRVVQQVEHCGRGHVEVPVGAAATRANTVTHLVQPRRGLATAGEAAAAPQGRCQARVGFQWLEPAWPELGFSDTGLRYAVSAPACISRRPRSRLVPAEYAPGEGPPTWAGVARRRQLLAEAGIVLGSDLGFAGEMVRVDDILDASVAALTELRVARSGAAAAGRTELASSPITRSCPRDAGTCTIARMEQARHVPCFNPYADCRSG